MPICSKCNASISADVLFCGACGQKQSPQSIPQPSINPAFINPSQNNDIYQQTNYAPRPTSSSPPLVAMLGIVFSVVMVGYFAMNTQAANKDRNDDDKEETTSSESEGPLDKIGSMLGSGPKEVDDPDDFYYTKKKETCKQHPIGQARDAASQIDRIILSQDSRVTREEEIQWGKESLGEIEEAMGGRLVRSGSIVDYLNDVGQPLTKYKERKEISYKFYLLEDTDVENAVALPDGHIVVTRPLFDNWLDNEAQLATVLGHEIAHVDLKHNLAVYEYSRRISDKDNPVVMIAVGLLSRGVYSTKREAHADEVGATWIHKKKYSTMQSVALWNGLDKDRNGDSKEEEKEENPFGELIEIAVKTIEVAVASHPSPDYRACKLKVLTYDLYQKDRLEYAYRGDSNYRLRKARSQKEY